ncbi:MAG: peptidylprolyl isomerase [Gemmatimonadaceae bacterium]
MRTAALAALSAAAIACAGGAGATRAAERSTLDSRAPTAALPTTAPQDGDVRSYARLLAMTDARVVDSALVESALASRWPALRAAAALAAGQVHAAALAPRLRALLADHDTSVAANAAFALGLLRDSASGAALGAALAAATPVAREAAWSLGEIGAPARSTIVAALRPDARAHAAARPMLLLAAAKLRPVPADAVLPYAAESAGDAALVRAAAYALGRGRVPAGARALLGLAAARDGETREHVARGLARSAAGDSLADSALATLRRLAADPDAHVRVSALRSLGGYGPRARQPIVAATRDSDANVRVAAAQSLANVLPATRGAWRDVWEADTGFMYRRSLVASAVTTGVVLPAIDEDNPDNWQRWSDWRYRAAVAEAAANAPQIERVREVTLPLTRDPDGRVRAAAWGVFAPWVDSTGAEQHPWRRQLLLGALRDEDFYVRATALAALATHARASEVPRVLASYELARRDSLNDARVAALRYLAAAWQLDSAAFTDSLRAAVAAIPVPADPLERAEGKGSTIFAAWRPSTGAPRPLAWYESAVRDVVLPALGGRPATAEIVTERGTIALELLGADAPLTVLNFVTLARAGFLSGTRFHRVVPAFVAQDGDPRGDGTGGPGYAIRDELNRRRYERGAIGMALSGPDTGGSQYFLTLSPQPHLDGHYTVFGRVSRGADVMDRLVQGDSILEVRVR